MFKFLKIVFLLVLLAAIALAAVYMIYEDRLYEEARSLIARELSERTGYQVDIGSVRFIPFQTIVLDRVTIRSGDETTESTLADIGSVTSTVDAFALIKRKQLRTTTVIEGLHADDSLCNATLRTESARAISLEKAFDPALIRSVFIIEAELALRKLRLNGIFGTLDVDRLSIPAGKIFAKHNGTGYYLTFNKLTGQLAGYDINLRSDNLGLETTIAKENTTLNVDKFEGMFHTLRFDFRGEINNFRSDDRDYSFNGTAEADLKSLVTLPGGIGEFSRNHPVSGTVRSVVNLTAASPSLADCDINITLAGRNIRMDNMFIDEINGKLAIKEGKLKAPFINGIFYNGTLAGDLVMDLLEKDLPFILTLAVSNADYGDLIFDLTPEEERVTGSLKVDLLLKGYARDPGSYQGTSELEITDADLGPMPILTPLLGDIFAKIQNNIPGMREVSIDYAAADFEIKNRRIITDNLIFEGKDLSITGEGYMDFDGNLNFSFQNELMEPSPDADEEWQESIRNAIISFGKRISRAHLKGTLADQKWEFEYLNPFRNP